MIMILKLKLQKLISVQHNPTKSLWNMQGKYKLLKKINKVLIPKILSIMLPVSSNKRLRMTKKKKERIDESHLFLVLALMKNI